jgi:hypothetical protein
MFIKDVKTTSKSQTYYKLPSYHGLHTYLLKQSKVIVSKLISKNIQNSIHKYGATICSNGWDNVARCPLLNTMIVCPNGDVFLSAIDIMGERKDTHYICNVLVKCIELVGVENFV